MSNSSRVCIGINERFNKEIIRESENVILYQVKCKRLHPPWFLDGKSPFTSIFTLQLIYKKKSIIKTWKWNVKSSLSSWTGLNKAMSELFAGMHITVEMTQKAYTVYIIEFCTGTHHCDCITGHEGRYVQHQVVRHICQQVDDRNNRHGDGNG